MTEEGTSQCKCFWIHNIRGYSRLPCWRVFFRCITKTLIIDSKPPVTGFYFFKNLQNPFFFFFFTLSADFNLMMGLKGRKFFFLPILQLQFFHDQVTLYTGLLLKVLFFSFTYYLVNSLRSSRNHFIRKPSHSHKALFHPVLFLAIAPCNSLLESTHHII